MTLFSAAEMRRRRAAVGHEMARRDLSYALVYAANRTGHAVSWLTGWPVTREALLLLGPDEADDVLLVSYFNHVPQARRMSRVPVEWAGERAGPTAVDLLRSRGAGLRRVGVLGPLPFDQYRAVAEEIGDVVDLGPAYTSLRLVKSVEEIAALRRAAELTDGAVAALADAIAPGTDEHALAARIEQSYVSSGGMHVIHYLGVTAMDDPEYAVPAQWPTSRRLQVGDVVTCEISVAVAPDYPGQVLRTFTVGAEPTPLYRRLHEVAMSTVDALCARLVPGTHAAELVAAAGAIEDAGFTVIDDVVHGIGGGYLPPVLRSPGEQRSPVPDLVLAAGMTVVVQPNVATKDGRAGVQTGEAMLVTSRGPERLHAYPPGLVSLQ